MIILANTWFLERRTILITGAALTATAVSVGLWTTRGHWQSSPSEVSAGSPMAAGPGLVGLTGQVGGAAAAAAPILGTPASTEPSHPGAVSPAGQMTGLSVATAPTVTATATLARLLPVAGASSTASAPPQPSALVTVTVRSADVYLRSGPSKAYYPTGKVQPGQTLTVVSERAGWLEVQPTADQFSWVSREFVRPEGPLPCRGVITGDNVRVRAGSTMMPNSRDTVQGKLARGSIVELLGESDGFFRIRPPAGATVWVSADLVTRIEAKVTTATGITSSSTTVPSPATTTSTTLATKLEVPAATGTSPSTKPATPISSDPLRSGRPTDADLDRSATRSEPPPPAAVAEAVAKPEPAPTARAVVTATRSDAEELDSTYAAMQAELRRPVAEQTLPPLVSRFQALRSTTANPRIQQWCDFYAADLQRRIGLQEAWREAERLRTQFDEDLIGRRPVAKPSAAKPAPTPPRSPPPPSPSPSPPKATPVSEMSRSFEAPSAVPVRPTRLPTPPPMVSPTDAKPTAPDTTGAATVELTGYLLESAYWESHKDQLGGAVRYRLVAGLPPEDIYIIWVQAGRGAPDLAARLGQRVTLRGAKVALPEHRSHVLLVESVQPAM